jgi:hypothetical protein
MARWSGRQAQRNVKNDASSYRYSRVSFRWSARRKNKGLKLRGCCILDDCLKCEVRRRLLKKQLDRVKPILESNHSEPLISNSTKVDRYHPMKETCRNRYMEYPSRCRLEPA